ncbi:MAG: helix-turn-helix transcriptional regulator [Rhizobacter sp.]|nr:helix-turn-helix transcriptional regulator [Rhizobacter sp.]
MPFIDRPPSSGLDGQGRAIGQDFGGAGSDAGGDRKDLRIRLSIAKFYKTRFVDMNTSYLDALPPHWEPLAAVFAALGDSYRQRILLMFERGERLSIKQISDVLPLSRTAALHHIRALQTAGLLHATKEGRATMLSVNKPLLLEALKRTLAYAEESL